MEQYYDLFTWIALFANCIIMLAFVFILGWASDTFGKEESRKSD